MSIVFKDVPRFPGYQVDGDGMPWTFKVKGGNDRSPDRFRAERKPLKVGRTKRGYCFVNLTRDGRNYRRLLHQLVLETFVGPKPAGMEGCHYPDPDKSNNRPENLRWDTHPENMKDRYRDLPPITEKACRRCGTTKLVGEFYRDKRASDGLKTECKTCHCCVARSTTDRETRRRNNREYMRRRRERARAS